MSYIENRHVSAKVSQILISLISVHLDFLSHFNPFQSITNPKKKTPSIPMESIIFNHNNPSQLNLQETQCCCNSSKTFLAVRRSSEAPQVKEKMIRSSDGLLLPGFPSLQKPPLRHCYTVSNMLQMNGVKSSSISDFP